MRARELVRKEIAELAASRAFWLLLAVVGILAGQSFITAVNAYAEASGIGGGPAALPQALTPLDGIIVPTLGAYDLVITLLVPFVAIRLIAAEKSSGALKLMLQWPSSLAAQLLAKVVALLLGWFVALVPFAVALALWRGYGGHLHAPELLNVLLGYTLRYLLTVAIAFVAAAVMPGSANAAIVVLAFTIGTWALDFVAAGRGGIVQTIASFTPAAVLRSFERGLLRVDVLLVIAAIALCLLAMSAEWLRLGRTNAAHVMRTVALVAVTATAVFAAARVRASYDVSENRRNSFDAGDERALRSIRDPLTVTVYLSAEDPRLRDFEDNVLTKLRRSVRDLRVVYPLAGRSGMFDNDDRYGEIVYALGAKQATSRSATEEIVLDTIYGLSHVAPPARRGSSFAGHPLAARPRGAAAVFYVVWPAAVAAAAAATRRRASPGATAASPHTR